MEGWEKSLLALLLNNIKISKKMFLIYLLAVVIPIVLTNLIIIHSIRENENIQQNKLMEITIERMKYHLNESLNEITEVSNYISRDMKINEFLQKKYKDNVDYYSNYISLIQENIINSFYVSQALESIEIYTTNPTIVNGGVFWDLRAVENTDWYKIYKENNQNMILYPYYEENKQFPPKLESSRTISFIRELPNGNNGYKSIVKININYYRLLANIKNEDLSNTIVIAYKDQIIFSNHGSENKNAMFRPLESNEKPAFNLSDSFLAINDRWDIYISNNQTNIFDLIENKKTVLLVLIIFNFLFPTLIILLINKSFQDRIALTEQHLLKVEKGIFERININEGKDEIGDLIRSYNFMVVKIDELLGEVYKKEREQQKIELAKTKAELNALQSQVNPHFLYNTLDSIRMRNLLNGDKESATVINELALLFRRMTKWSDSYFVTVEEEIAYVQRYLNIQKYRFVDRLNFSIYVEEECKAYYIPKMLILTFVENACIHGIEKKKDGGEISIIVSKQDEAIYIEILDSGIGMDEKRLMKIKESLEKNDITTSNWEESTGILNAYLRLKMHYQQEVELVMESQMYNGTEVCIKLPII
ncbi:MULTISPECIES: sensor histidine kinase [Bacillaceae]|uniref:sensor histidine kinase n=1 Tax=Bacillaceae TaxID=186817 RepID=UPI0009DF94F3|nr:MULTISPECIES: histidine kinase [Bacillaceae]MCM3361086.1 histidine kinase [Niallia sp. MER TA 168]